jgi:gliding motility-associated-like protein
MTKAPVFLGGNRHVYKKFTAVIRKAGLICSVLLCSSLLSSQTLYWVGNSGNWNDPQHWAYSAGGNPANTVPGPGNSVVLSTDSRIEIHITTGAYCSGITCLPRADKASILMDPGAELNVLGNAELCDSLFVRGGRLVFSGGNFALRQKGASLETSIVVNGANLEAFGGLSLGRSGCVSIEQGSLITGGESIITGKFQLGEHATWTNRNTSLHCNERDGLYLKGTVVSEGNGVKIYRPFGAEDYDRQWEHRDDRIEFDYRQLPTCATGPGQTPFTIDAIVISNYNGEDISCNGANDGIATVSVTGGIGPFLYQWIGGDVPGFTQNYNNLGAGTYTVLVTDLAQGVTCVDNVQLAEPPPITIFSLLLTPPSCEGLCNGRAIPIAIGGVPGYQYLWSSGETGFQAVQLCEGINSVIITDSNGCAFDSIFPLNRNPIEFGLVVSEILCAGESTGEASASPSGGVGGPYVISWSNGQSGPSATGLSADSYTLTVTDAANCTVDTTFTITELPGIEILEENITDETCAGNQDGAISINVNGGTLPYNYLWSGPNGFSDLQEDISGIGAGTYTVIVVDANGCEEESSYTIEAPPAIELSGLVTEIDCQGEATGAIDLSISGGEAPYLFQWEGPEGFTSLDEDLSNLGAGIYIVTITDALLCSDSTQYEVIEPDPIELNEVVQPVSCAEGNDGAITLDVSGGTPPYTFAWEGPGGFTSASEDLSGITSGTYSLTITDANDCSSERSFILDEPTPLEVDTQIQDPTCNESADGSIEITISGGQEPYAVSWSGPDGFGTASEDISGLFQGSYSLEVTDAAGCIFESDYLLEAPQALLISGEVSDVSCGGLEDGSIAISISGGTSPYLVQWEGPNGFLSDQEDINALDSGAYNLTVTDNQGCEATATFEIDENPTLEAEAALTSIDCAGNANGSIDLSPTGGSEPYSFSWTGPEGFTSITEDISGLLAGDYSLLLTDASACTFEVTFTLDQPDPIQVLAEVSPITCSGLADGFINSSAEGGVGPYNYSWIGPGGFASASPTIGPLSPGVYILTVTDAQFCESEAEFELSDPLPLELLSVVEDVSCAGLTDGTIDLSVLGGTPGYTFSWAGPNGFVSEQEDIINLSEGSYQVEVTDEAGCTISAIYEVEGQEILQATTELTDVTCFGESDGGIVLNIFGGVAPYAVSWTGPEGFVSSQKDISDLSSGTYHYTVVDFNGCLVEGSIEIEQPEELSATWEAIPPSCFGLIDGSIVLTIGGGEAPYEVSWSGGENGEELNGLGSGSYQATITDSGGCELVLEPIVLEESPEIVIDFDVTNVICAGAAEGAIDAAVNGGVPGYSYAWEGPEGFTSATEDIEGLLAGSYTLQVSDSEGCIAEGSIDITSPELIEISAVLSQPICLGGTGAIDVSIEGGTGPYIISWSGPGGFVSAEEDITNLIEGSYQAEVVDSNGCFGQSTFEIGSLNPLVIEAEVLPVDCSGEDNGSIALTLSGGVPGYSYSWSGPGGFTSIEEDLSQLAQGDYMLTVIDGQACSVDTTFTITAPVPLSISVTEESPLCAQENTGALDVSISGGFPPYNYSWNGPDGYSSEAEDLSGLNPGDYELVVTDQGSCVADSVFTLTEVPGIFIDAALTDILCGGLSTGSITLEVSGGTLPYVFNWSGPNGYTSADQSLENLEGGEYDLTLSDANGCSIDTTFTLVTPPPIEVVFVVDNPLCGVLDGSIDAEVIGGEVALDYVYEWFDISDGGEVSIGNGPSLNNLGPGLYEFVVSDDNGCFYTEIIPLSDEPGYIEITTTDLLCPGGTEGSISVEVFQGTPPYVVVWTGPGGFTSSEEDITDLSAGEYFLVITDANNCEINEVVTLSEPEELSLELQVSDVTCNGGNNGSIDIEVSGGTAPYTFDWTGDNGFSSEAEDLNEISTGQYSLLLSDANGCQADTFALINESQLLEVVINFTEALCEGGTNGTIDLEVLGGTAPYSYTWSGPEGFNSAEQDLLSLVAGDYALMLLDSEGCFRDTVVTIAEASPIEVVLDILHPSCGENNGSVSATGSGGVISIDYSYAWFDVSSGVPVLLGTENEIGNLENGIYELELTDDLGCQTTETFNLSDIGGSLEGLVNGLSCFSGSDGAIDLSIIGGLAPFTVVWNGPNGFNSEEEDITGLYGGEYAVQVTDADGCGFTAIFNVDRPEEISIEIAVVNSLCNGSNNGSISVAASGGTGNKDVTWIGPEGYSSNEELISGLIPGCYQLMVQDEAGCTSDSTLCLVEPEAIVINASVTDILCGGEGTGAIDALVSGGTPEFSFVWSGPEGFTSQESEDINDLFAGTYTLLVNDINGCEISRSFIVQENTPLSADTSLVSPLCFGSADGSIELQIEGGTQPISIEWTGPDAFSESGAIISDVSAGEYIWVVNDNNGCLLSDTIVLSDPEEILVDAIAADVTCFGFGDGIIDLQLSGGVPAYTVLWTGPNGYTSAEQDISNLIPGTYQYVVSDSNECLHTGTIQIEEPAELLVNINNAVNPSCPDSFDGAIDIEIQGGVPDYSVIWTNSLGEPISSDVDLVGLGPEVYTAEISDSNGCMAFLPDNELIALTSVNAEAPADTSYCEGQGPWLLTGEASGQDSVAWHDGNGQLVSESFSVLIDPSPGTWFYVFTAFATPCLVRDTIYFTVLAAPFADAGEDQFIFPEGSINIGGNPSITDENVNIEWTPSANLDNSGSPNPLLSGLDQDQWFVLSVIDENGCTSEDSVLVSIIPEMDIPDGFSPNGDLTNDVWEIGNAQLYPSLVVEIYNRWGDLLFRSEGYDQPWDGRYNGDLLPIGTYYYIIEIDEPLFSDKITGPLTILR